MKMTPFAMVGRVPHENICRSGVLFKDTKEMCTLAAELMPGFKSELGVILGYTLDNAGKQDAIQTLEEERTYWQRITDVLSVFDKESNIVVRVPPTMIVTAFEKLYYDSKGNLKVPAYGAITGNRRHQAWVLAQAARLSCGKTLLADWPVVVQDFESALERGLACIAGNVGIDNGRLKLGPADIVQSANRIYMLGGKEADLAKAGFNRGMRQKLWVICDLNRKFPELNLVDRIVSGKIDFGPLDKEVMRILSQGQAKNNIEPAGLDEVSSYFDNPREKKKNDLKILSKTQMDNLIARYPVDIVRETLFAVRANKSQNLEKFIKFAEQINKLTRELGITVAPATPVKK